MTAIHMCARDAIDAALLEPRRVKYLSRRTVKSIKHLIALIALPLSWSGGADAKAPLAFQSKGKWTLTGDDGQCFLTHAYDNAAGIATLRIDQFPRQYGFRTTISFTYDHGAHVVVPATIGPNGNTKTRRVETIEIFSEEKGGNRVYRTHLVPDDFDQASKIGFLIVTPARHIGLQIPIPQLSKAIIALRRCEQVLYENSGLPPEDMKRLKSYPEPRGYTRKWRFEQINIGRNADPADVAVSRGIINAQGMPTTCEVIHQAKSKILNTEACSRIMNLTFDPATDSQNKPVPGLFFVETLWPGPG